MAILEQHTIILFLTFQGLKPLATFPELDAVDDKKSITLSTVKEWHLRFVDKDIRLLNVPWSGRAPQKDPTEPIQLLFKPNRFISCNVISRMMNIAESICLHVFHDDFGLKSSILNGHRIDWTTIGRGNALFFRFSC
jgi:hypothetical protein